MGLPRVESLSGLHEFVLAYSEAPNSILVKNMKMIEFYQFIPITPISPRWANGCLGSLGLLLFLSPCCQHAKRV